MTDTVEKREKLPPHFFAEFERTIQKHRNEGHTVIRLDVGSPDLPPPSRVIRALIQAARLPDVHGYQSQRGIKELRLAWAEMYARTFGVRLDAETEILPLMGSKEGIFHLSQAFLEPRDVVLVPNPGYATYARGAEFVGAEVVPLPLDAQRGFTPQIEELPSRVLKRVRLIWLNYPHNPTGGTAEVEALREILLLAEREDILVCHDAAYAQVVYDEQKAFSIFQVSPKKEQVVEFNTLSKAYNMAGWRSGVIVGDASVIESLFRLKCHYDSGQFFPMMQAACAALSTPEIWIQKRNRVYQSRRDVVVQGLRAIGLEAYLPKGGIYVWARLPQGWDSLTFVNECLEATHVALTPGVIFGSSGEGHVRIALVAPLDQLQEAMQRLKGWFRT